MKDKPRHDWVIVESEKTEEAKSAGGIILTPAFKPTKKAVVVDAGPQSSLKKGMTIIHNAGAGVPHEDAGKMYLLLRDLPSEIYLANEESGDKKRKAAVRIHS